MGVISKSEADAYDRMIDAAAELADLLEQGGIELEECALEELTIFLAGQAPAVLKLLKHLKHQWP